MSTKYYVKDENGKVLSIDGKTRFTVYVDSEARAFLQTKEGKNKNFYKFISPDGEKFAIECTKEQQEESEYERRHYTYLRKQEEEKGYIQTSLDCPLNLNDEDVELIESIEDESSNLNEITIRHDEYDCIHKALDSLTEEEFDLVFAFFILKKPMTEREYAEKNGLHHMTVHNRKVAVLKKISKFL